MMRVATHVKHQVTLPINAHALFEWFGREGVFSRLTPPWEQVTLLSRDPGLEAGNRTHFIVKEGPFSFPWVSEQVDYEFNESFTDMQIKGPFSYWHHLHRFRYLTEDSSIMEDTVRYIPPGGPLVQLLFRRRIKHKIKTVFRYRSRVLFNDLTCVTRYDIHPLRILIAGGTGFIGKELEAFLISCGHTVSLLTRHPTKPHHIAWDPTKGQLDPKDVEGFDVWINLAGENITTRWTTAKKESIRASRIDATRLLAATINHLSSPPATFISASAIGYYGTKTPSPVNETGSPGDSFLASVCTEWEAEAQKANCRVVIPRFGVVLSPKGGMLKQMLPTFRLGLGGVIGTGEQRISWITLDDLLYQMYHVICTKEIEGPVNFVTENEVTNEEFTRLLSKTIHRPSFFTIPQAIIRLFFGQMGEETILSSATVLPKKLGETGSTFAYPTLSKAFEHLFPK